MGEGAPSTTRLLVIWPHISLWGNRVSQCFITGFILYCIYIYLSDYQILDLWPADWLFASMSKAVTTTSQSSTQEAGSHRSFPSARNAWSPSRWLTQFVFKYRECKCDLKNDKTGIITTWKIILNTVNPYSRSLDPKGGSSTVSTGSLAYSLFDSVSQQIQDFR